jgi:hypothetical protein
LEELAHSDSPAQMKNLLAENSREFFPALG